MWSSIENNEEKTFTIIYRYLWKFKNHESITIKTDG